MLAIPPQTRIYLHREPTDMRKSFHGLVALTETVLRRDPLSGHLFVFLNRRRDRIKLLYWGGVGYCIWYQQLQEGTYQLPIADDLAGMDKLEISGTQLSLILNGIDLSSVRQRKRFQLSDRQAKANAASLDPTTAS